MSEDDVKTRVLKIIRENQKFLIESWKDGVFFKESFEGDKAYIQYELLCKLEQEVKEISDDL